MSLEKFLCVLSGEDYEIITRCSIGIRRGFIFVGSIVLVIYGITLVSTYIILFQLFQNVFLGLLLSVFVSWMLTNIYLLLLYTLTESSLPYVRDSISRFLSVALRMLFICFMAVIMSKPLEALLLSETLDKDIAHYKAKCLDEYSLHLDNYFAEQEKVLVPLADPGALSSVQLENRSKKAVLVREMTALVDNSNFFIHRIRILSTQYYSSWLTSAFLAFIFILPALYKGLWLATDPTFNNVKSQVETLLVKGEYNEFKAKFYQIIDAKLQVGFSNESLKVLAKSKLDKEMFDILGNMRKLYPNAGIVTEHFIDPPFNTVRKTENRKFKTESDLVQSLYGG